METLPTPSTDWKVGDVIESRYEIVEQIGIGGMGVVWKVHHREWDRILALKMPLPHLVGSLALKERFVREAETWVGLGVHPHIVQCWYVLSITGRPCLFLDFLTGGSLKDRLADGTVSPGKWIAIMELAMQVASGLAHSHSRGVIHRDVKPENLLFKADGTICVTDFGLVKTAMPDTIERETGLARSNDTSVSGAGAYLGTPQYGAPEQWGSAERVGPAADIYAFGITLYEMCCGRRPFDVEGDTSITLGDLINAHLKVKPPDPREFFAQIPEDLVLLCQACLEKDPARRPPSMTAVHQVLAALHFRLTGTRYPTVVPLPNSASPDILNNSGVSLSSLGKNDEARQAWRKGLRQESAHAECLYNLTQLERREGRIGTQESLRRLQQAKANYPLALFCIEQGLSKEAVTILSEIVTEDKIKKGLVQRALGDALMYTQQYYAAEKAYQIALRLMPNDDYTHQRKTAASLGRRDNGGVVLFPLSVPRTTFAIGEPFRAIVSDDGGYVLCVTGREFLRLDVANGVIASRAPRLDDARPVERAWIHGHRLLMQEQGAFQLRTLPDLQLLGRKGGRVLAVAPDLTRMVLLTREGPTLFSFDKNTFEPISGADPEPGSHGPHASFDRGGTALAMLLATGELAHLDKNHRAVPSDYPSVFEQPQNPTSLAIGLEGKTVFIGYACGTVNAYDTVARALIYSVKMPGPVHGLELAGDDLRLVVDLRVQKTVLDETGSVLWQGPGPLKVEPGGRRILSFTKGVLHLHECHPFHQSRRWEGTVEGAIGLEMAHDGSLAVSYDRQGGVQVWEVAEDHRVYEHSLLLSPGQTYQELVRGALAFPEALNFARQALEEGQWLDAYRNLLKARGIMGYGQMPAALDLNWALIDKMGRDQVDAVWDRLTIGGKTPGPVDINPAGDHLLVIFSRQISVRLETASASRILWAHTSRGRILAARLEENGVLFVEESGRVVRLSMDDGRLFEEFKIEAGLLVDVHLLDSSLLYATASAQVGSFDLSARKTTSQTPVLAKPVHKVFPWINGSAIVVTEDEFGVVELGKKPGGAIAPFSGKTYKPEARITFGCHDAKHRLLILGSEDGTLAITDATSGKLLYAVGKVSGPVTGFALLPELAAGVVTTARGQLYLWDMLADKVLEGLLAHRGGIVDLKVDSTGRHLVTSGKDGQVRLWETSWTASLSLEQKPRLEWLPADTAFTKLARFFRRG